MQLCRNAPLATMRLTSASSSADRTSRGTSHSRTLKSSASSASCLRSRSDDTQPVSARSSWARENSASASEASASRRRLSRLRSRTRLRARARRWGEGRGEGRSRGRPAGPAAGRGASGSGGGGARAPARCARPPAPAPPRPAPRGRPRPSPPGARHPAAPATGTSPARAPPRPSGRRSRRVGRRRPALRLGEQRAMDALAQLRAEVHLLVLTCWGRRGADRGLRRRWRAQHGGASGRLPSPRRPAPHRRRERSPPWIRSPPRRRLRARGAPGSRAKKGAGWGTRWAASGGKCRGDRRGFVWRAAGGRTGLVRVAAGGGGAPGGRGPRPPRPVLPPLHRSRGASRALRSTPPSLPGGRAPGPRPTPPAAPHPPPRRPCPHSLHPTPPRGPRQGSRGYWGCAGGGGCGLRCWGRRRSCSGKRCVGRGEGAPRRWHEDLGGGRPRGRGGPVQLGGAAGRPAAQRCAPPPAWGCQTCVKGVKGGRRMSARARRDGGPVPPRTRMPAPRGGRAGAPQWCGSRRPARAGMLQLGGPLWGVVGGMLVGWGGLIRGGGVPRALLCRGGDASTCTAARRGRGSRARPRSSWGREPGRGRGLTR
jgi:hypothetical protein